MNRRTLFPVSLLALPPVLIGGLLFGRFTASPADATSSGATAPAAASIAPKERPALPADPSRLWIAPIGVETATPQQLELYAALRKGVELYKEGKPAQALPLVSAPGLQETPLAAYASYYRGLAQQALARYDEARETLHELAEAEPLGQLSWAARIAEGEVAEAREDYDAAVRIYAGLADDRTLDPGEILFRLGRVALKAGDRARAAGAFRTLYYEYPLNHHMVAVEVELKKLRDLPPADPGGVYDLDLARAQRLFGAGRYSGAAAMFREIRSSADGQDRALVDLRLAQCEYHLRRYPSALSGVEPLLDHPAYGPEARFYEARALRALGRDAEYVRRTRELVEGSPASPWAEDALDALGTHYILEDRDADAARVFREQYERFPLGRHADRAAWKAGWWAYTRGDYAETIELFESAVLGLPDSDSRPSFLYWAARSHERLGRAALAAARYRVTVVDYGNSYYGRLAARRLADPVLQQRAGEAGLVEAAAPAPGAGVPDVLLRASADQSGNEALAPAAELPPNHHLIRLLIAVELYNEALAEVQYARLRFGDSPALTATEALVQNRRGELRRGITLMKRAYPHYIAEGGDQLPDELLKIIFPVDHWDLLREHARARNLDPYLVAALVAQESTFVADIRSAANAYGLMQILPSTGRRMARSLGIRRFSTRMLTNPETNVRMGTLFFSRLVDMLGGVHLALAGYNAGDSRVRRWIADRQGLEPDEFIDDIPFPETQNYVKKILGTADDYRRLYGE